MILAVARMEVLRALGIRRVLIVFTAFAVVALTMGRAIGQPPGSSDRNQWDIAFDLVHDSRWVVWIVIPLLLALTIDLLIWSSSDRESLILIRLMSKPGLVTARVLAAGALGPAYVIIGLAGTVIAGLTFAEWGIGTSSYAWLPLHDGGSLISGKLYALPAYASFPSVALLIMGLYIGVAATGFVVLLALVSCQIALRPWMPSAVVLGAVMTLWRAGNSPWNPLTHVLWQSHVPNVSGTTTPWLLSLVLIALAYLTAIKVGSSRLRLNR